MNREITKRELKIRAFRKSTNDMVYNVGFHPHLSIDLSADDDYYVNNQDGRWLFSPSENNILMQFTGLKDKNGKEIYEGDICYLGKEFSPSRKKVIYEEEYGRYIFNNLSSIGISQLCRDGYCDVLIIGNVYEHPELLTNL